MGSSNDLSSDEDVETDTQIPVETPTPKSKGKRKRGEPEEGGGSGSKSGKKTRSWVWDHFERQKDDKDKANCKYCDKEMSCPTRSGTSNMKKHLNFACKAYQVWAAANNVKGRQTVLAPDGGNGELRVCKVSPEVVREASNEMLVLAELPLAFIESLAWKHFCSRVQLQKPHSRRTATRDIVKAYAKRKEAMKKILQDNKQRLSITTDIWVSQHTGTSYMVITAHFIDRWWHLKKLIIGFKNVYDHKGATICSVLIDCLKEWDIKRVFCITVDNATANSSAMKRFKEEFSQNGDDALVLQGQYLHLRCATHIINLVVREGMLEIDNSVNAIRNSIHYMRSSTPRLKSFEQRVESGKIQRGSLPLDVKTRWNSTYLMLEQALKFRLAFEKMNVEDKPYNDYFAETVEGKKRLGPPVKTDWEAVDRLVRFLIIFYKATLVLSVTNTICSHKLYHAIVTITRNLTALSKAPGPDEMLRSKAVTMLGKLEKYWNPFGVRVEMNRLVIVATVFDPSKKMKLVDKCIEKLYGKDDESGIQLHDDVMDILRRLFVEYSALVDKTSSGVGDANSQSHGTSSHSHSQSQSQSQDQFVDEVSQKTYLGNGLAYESMNDLYDELVQETDFAGTPDELEMYLNETVEIKNRLPGSEFDVLSWWRLNSPKFPVLSLIARDILAMQASSVASESAFSTSGRILEPSRSCLTPFMVEVLMCDEQWLKCEIKVNEQGVTSKEQLLADVELQDELMREFEPAFQES